MPHKVGDLVCHRGGGLREPVLGWIVEIYDDIEFDQLLYSVQWLEGRGSFFDDFVDDGYCKENIDDMKKTLEEQ